MRYLITTTDGQEPFFTEWFDVENHFNSELGMVVFDLATNKYLRDGFDWTEIPEDHL